jgi:hypothetical protein
VLFNRHIQRQSFRCCFGSHSSIIAEHQKTCNTQKYTSLCIS